MIVSAAHASKMYVMDTPTTNILNYGSYDVSFRMFGYGGVHTRLDFGVFKFFNIGVSWELDRFIGNDQIEMAVPALSVKFRLYEGNMKWPGIALGFDGQGYFGILIMILIQIISREAKVCILLSAESYSLKGLRLTWGKYE